MKSSVLLIIFNRPDTTKRVFEEIKKAKPKKLYIAADGPRLERNDDINKCSQAREIVNDVDWNCVVNTLYSDRNLGCKVAVSRAINWFFSNEEEGIILEDDCLPSQSFFSFCDDQLAKFRDDKRIFLISGYNKQNTWKEKEADYFFSNYGGIWGWASWRRAWMHNDLEMNDLEEFIKQNKLKHLLGSKQGKIREKQMRAAKAGHNMNTWDFQWGYSRHVNSGMACVPSRSLIENIGFGSDATHTSINTSSIKVKRHELITPLKENRYIIADKDYDNLFFKDDSILIKIKSKIETTFTRKK